MNECEHEALLDSDVTQGVGYMESILYRCGECGAGVHVNFPNRLVWEKVTSGSTVGDLFKALGITLRGLKR